MERTSSYYKSQIQAIENFYRQLRDKNNGTLSVEEAIIVWFAEGYAERFREEYLRRHPVLS